MKRFMSLMMTLILSISLIACSSPQATDESKVTENQDIITENAETTYPIESDDIESEPEVTETANTVTYPVIIIDQAGREVIIEKEPEKLVSGYYISTSLLIALDKKDELVGIEAKADKRPIYSLSAPELIDLPNVGTAKEFDLEGCAALEPDLVILPLKLKDAAATLADLGITTLIVNPESTELLNEMIHIVATATNTLEQAEALYAFTDTNTEVLKTVTHDAPKPTVYLAGNSSFLSTAGSNMYQHSMIETAGGTNVAAEITDSYWTEVSYEQILTWNPEYIILASDASYTCEDVLNDPNLTDCSAVANGNVYQLPYSAESWDSPVPSGILGSVWLCSTLHSDLMKREECNQIIKDYYETFYDFEYPEE